MCAADQPTEGRVSSRGGTVAVSSSPAPKRCGWSLSRPPSRATAVVRPMLTHRSERSSRDAFTPSLKLITSGDWSSASDPKQHAPASLNIGSVRARRHEGLGYRCRLRADVDGIVQRSQHRVRSRPVGKKPKQGDEFSKVWVPSQPEGKGNDYQLPSLRRRVPPLQPRTCTSLAPHQWHHQAWLLSYVGPNERFCPA